MSQTPRRRSPRRETLKILGFWIASTALVLLVAEGALRLAGYPKGRFISIYPPNERIEMTWGPIPYTVETNSLGLRSREITYKKAPGRTRILMIGDSVTDGFFADNQDTYPWRLEENLRRRDANVEVVNAGMGGGSIDRSFSVLTSFVKLEPDLVILTFVTNDIAEIAGKRPEDLVSLSLENEGSPFETSLPAPRRAARWLLTHTATAEAVFDTYLRVRFRSYRAAERNGPAADRYRIPGGEDHEANAAEFRKRYARTDGLVLAAPLAPETRALVASYVAALEHLAAYCREREAHFVLVFLPCYPHIYDPSASLEIRDLLASACAERGIPFIDATDRFREAGRARVLHLAPVDFHLNPQGNEVLAEAVADRLLELDLVRRR